jgi:phosphomevalonate kinase
MSLHSAKEEEEAKDIFHLPRNFYLWINQLNNPSLTNILLKKKRKFLNSKIKAEFFWVVQTFKDKRQISQRFRLQISSKKKHSLTG